MIIIKHLFILILLPKVSLGIINRDYINPKTALTYNNLFINDPIFYRGKSPLVVLGMYHCLADKKSETDNPLFGTDKHNNKHNNKSKINTYDILTLKKEEKNSEEKKKSEEDILRETIEKKQDQILEHIGPRNEINKSFANRRTGYEDTIDKDPNTLFKGNQKNISYIGYKSCNIGDINGNQPIAEGGGKITQNLINTRGQHGDKEFAKIEKFINISFNKLYFKEAIDLERYNSAIAPSVQKEHIEIMKKYQREPSKVTDEDLKKIK